MNGQFYSQGFSVVQIGRDKANHLLEIMRRENFLPVSDIFDVYSKKTVSVKTEEITEPDFNIKVKDALKQNWLGVHHPHIWKKGVNGESNSICPDYPDEVISFWKDFSKEYLAWFNQTWGGFDHLGLLSHQYHQGQSLGFHHDLSDSTELNCIGYLGAENYQQSDGGYLEIAECDVDFDGMPILSSIKTIKKIMPNHGTVVVLDNTNPRLLHRVEPLYVTKERITLSCQFGRLSNVLRKKTNKK